MKRRNKNIFYQIDEPPFEWCSQHWSSEEGYSILVQKIDSDQLSTNDARQLEEWNQNCLLVYTHISNFAQKTLTIETLPLHFFYHDRLNDGYTVRPCTDPDGKPHILRTDPWVIDSGAKVGDELVIDRPHPRGHTMRVARKVV